MSRNRKRGSNPIELGRVYLWMALLFVLAVFGLSMVYMKNSQHAMGDQRRVLEKQLREVDQEIATVNSQVVEWSSRAVLQRRLDEGFVALVPIPDDRIVRLHQSYVPPGEEEILPVATAGR